MRVDGNHHHHISRSYAMLVMNRVTSLDLAQSSQLSLSLSLSRSTQARHAWQQRLVQINTSVV